MAVLNLNDLSVGRVLPDFAIGRISTSHIMRWSAASENWHRIHYDQRFATEHDGLPDVVINGSFKQHLLINMLDVLFGDGALVDLSVEFRDVDVAGDDLIAFATVSGVENGSDGRRITLDVGIRNARGKTGTRGSATILLAA